MENELNAQEQRLLDLVAEHGSMGNGKAQELLGWADSTYERVKEALVAKGLLVKGRGRGGSLQVAGGQQASKPKGQCLVLT